MRRRLATLAGAAAVAGAGAAPAVRRAMRARRPPAEDMDRWHAVTVLCPPKEAEARRDTPLAALGDAVEVSVRQAPGERGSEVRARLAPAVAAGDDAGERLEELRTALRETRQVLEIGWVVNADRPTTNRPTPLNAPLRAAIAHGKGRGRP
jgi:hypothetical protein